MNILLTGFTGNLGPSIAAALADHRVFALVRNGAAPAMRNVMKVTGELDHLPDGVCGDVEVIIHAAANTGFTTPLDELRAVNVTGTEKLLAYARRCPRLQRFVHLSTCCACGTASGTIPEGPLKRPDHFINPYEQSKWEAEQAIQTSGLPYQIVRLSIVAGSETDGHVRHPGALHHALLWLYRGLIPMMPGTVEAPVDVISLEFAAACVAEAVNRTQAPAPVVHAALGARAPRLGELLEHCAGLFRQEHRGWQGGGISLPDIVDARTFALFEQSARQTGDLLFQRVCEDAQSFLPGLLHPRVYAAEHNAHLPSGDWRQLLTRVFTHLKTTHWQALRGSTT